MKRVRSDQAHTISHRRIFRSKMFLNVEVIQLTPFQEGVKGLIQAVDSRNQHLVRAVTGAGKTE